MLPVFVFHEKSIDFDVEILIFLFLVSSDCEISFDESFHVTRVMTELSRLAVTPELCSKLAGGESQENGDRSC